jgi:hypothetical protein
MKDRFSTREAAEKLGVTLITLQRHVAAETVDAPKRGEECPKRDKDPLLTLAHRWVTDELKPFVDRWQTSTARFKS